MSRVLVIGDSCKDIFVYCSCSRLAPEFPVQVLDAVHKSENGGMAKNVEANITTLSIDCSIITNPNWESITKTRYVDKDSNYMFVRVDSKCDIQPCRVSVNSVDWTKFDAVIVSDYDKGFLSIEYIKAVFENHSCVFLDTKKPLNDWATGAKFIKINDKEYTNPKNVIDNQLHNKIIHTVGSRGCMYRDKSFSVKKVDVKDVSGAGDTFLAGLVARYLETGNIERAIKYANKCSTAAVQQKGISTT